MNFNNIKDISIKNKKIIRIHNNRTGKVIWPKLTIPVEYTKGNMITQQLTNNIGSYISLSSLGLETNCKIIFSIIFNSLSSSSEDFENILGYFDENLNISLGLQILNNQLYFNNELVQNFSLSIDTEYLIIIDGNKLFINNVLMHESLNNFYLSSLGIFNYINSNNQIDSNNQANISIKNITIQKNNLNIKEFIPVVNNINNNIGFYELITNTFYYDTQNILILE